MRLADRLFGQRGATILASWFAEQIARVDDPAFARRFSGHVGPTGIAREDFNHRLVHTSNGRLLGGIRFYGQDVTRPFVEVVAHDFWDQDALRECVAREWSNFAPACLRIAVSPGAGLPPHGSVDTTVFAARFTDMETPDGRVILRPFAQVDEAIEIVGARYKALSEEQPSLARNISAAEPADLRRWWQQDALRAVALDVDGRCTTVGLFAASWGAIEWIEGDEVGEEVISKPFNGRGLAASAQAAWAARTDVDAGCLLVGTIDSENVASRKSAIRAGRRAILDYVFMPLVESTLASHSGVSQHPFPRMRTGHAARRV